MRRTLVILLAAVLLLGGVAVAQSSGENTLPITAQSMASGAPAQAAAPRAPKPSPAPAPPKHKIGPLEISVNWRTRLEGWNFFEGNTGNSDYAFWHSQLRIGLGQTRERFDWFVEGQQVALVGLPDKAVVAAPQGQLGLGGSYFAANNNHTNVANGSLRQAFVNFKGLGPAGLKLGRFEYLDGMEVKPRDPLLATVIQTRIANRLISNFGFTTSQRSLDGVQFSLNSGPNNFTFLGARPTQGVFQMRGTAELDVDTYYGAYTRSVSTKHSAGDLRVFAIGYIDHRTHILKTDNRPTPVRSADLGRIEIATWGADYVHVFNTPKSGKFDLLAWGLVQTGAWGNLTQRAGAFVAEAGWQPPVKTLKPWMSLGYSFGSGDSNPNDSRHGTFFMLLPTPRVYARFPFYNMMNNEDFYGTLNVRPVPKLLLRSEAHALRLANSADFWYSGGGAFQPQTFGFTGRPSNGSRGLGNVWDLSGDVQVNKYFSTTIYYGHNWGKSVIQKIYPKDKNGQFAYLETNFRF